MLSGEFYDIPKKGKQNLIFFQSYRYTIKTISTKVDVNQELNGKFSSMSFPISKKNL